jgi:ASC-1-like (ASCH) protein
MQTITKKIYPEYFQQILDGKKKFEVRLSDFDIEEGDLTKEYTGREITKTVGLVGKWKLEHFEKFWDRKDIDDKGLMVISLLD